MCTTEANSYLWDMRLLTLAWPGALSSMRTGSGRSEMCIPHILQVLPTYLYSVISSLSKNRVVKLSATYQREDIRTCRRRILRRFSKGSSSCFPNLAAISWTRSVAPAVLSLRHPGLEDGLWEWNDAPNKLTGPVDVSTALR